MPHMVLRGPPIARVEVSLDDSLRALQDRLMRLRVVRAPVAAGILLVAALVLQPLLADTVILRNGTTINGTILNQSRTAVIIRIDGRVQTIPKANIRRIRYGGEAANKAAAERKREEEQKRAEEERRKAEHSRKQTEPGGQKKSEHPAASSPELTPGAILWRSALLPGWGFLQLKQDRWAWTYMGLVGGGVLSSLALRSQAREAKARYEDNAGGTIPAFLTAGNGQGTVALLLLNQIQDNQNYKQYRIAAARLRSAISFTAFVYVAQLFHAYLAGRSTLGPGTTAADYDSNARTALAFFVHLEPLPTNGTAGQRETKVGAAVLWRFR